MPTSHVVLVPSETEQSEVRHPGRKITSISIAAIFFLWGTAISIPLLWFWMGLYQEDITQEPREATTVDIWTSVLLVSTSRGPAPPLPDDSGRLPQHIGDTYSTIRRTQSQATSTESTMPTRTYRSRPSTTSTTIQTTRRRKRSTTATTETGRPATTTVLTSTTALRRASTTNKFDNLPTYTGDFDIDDPDFSPLGEKNSDAGRQSFANVMIGFLTRRNNSA